MARKTEDPAREELRRIEEEANRPAGSPDLATAEPRKAPRVKRQP